MIRLLCVGLGGMGRHDWGSAINCGRFEAVGGVDVSDEARAAFAEATGAPTFDDVDSALAAVDAQAALVSTPDAYHAPLSIRALEAGLDVICEKPMAETMDDARRMHQTAVDHNRMLMIHHQLRWHPTWFEARRQLDAGAIGTLRRIDWRFSVHSDVCMRGYRSRLPHLVFQDLSIHHFDLIRYLTGAACASVYAKDWLAAEPGREITAPTDAVAILEFDGPVTATYTAGVRELLDPVGYTCEAHLYGSEGELHVGREQLRLQTRTGHADGDEPRTITPEPPALGPWASFGEAMTTRQPTLTHSGDNLGSLALMFAAIESSESGGVITPEGV